jgi:peptide/nickel transport system permease protein
VQLGLNDPFPVRYVHWVANAVHGDLGTTFRTGEPVLRALSDHFVATLQIGVAALLVGVIVALPLGILSAVRPGRPIDHASRVLALLGASMPSFWLGYVLIIVFAVMLRMLPVGGYGDMQHLALPALTLGLGAAASLTRLTRASLLEVLDEDSVPTARAKGLPARRAILGHALRSALIPITTMIGMRFGHLLGGAVIVETVFAWPGIGKYVVDSIYDRDYPTRVRVEGPSGTRVGRATRRSASEPTVNERAMDPELAQRQAEDERVNAGHAPTLPAYLSEAQLDGRACIRCGDESEPKRPIEASSVLSSQLFEYIDSPACDQRASNPVAQAGADDAGAEPT